MKECSAPNEPPISHTDIRILKDQQQEKNLS